MRNSVDPDGRLRKTPRQARSRNTVEAILEAAERVLRSEGYHAASTNRMARVAGFSVGSLYQYFDDKQAVVAALLHHALRAEAERIGQGLDGLAKLGPALARDRLVRAVFAERRSKAHLLRILDAHGPDLFRDAPLRFALRAQAGVLADPLHRFAAAHLADAFRGAFDEGLAVAARFVHAASYALVVDAPEHLADEAVVVRVVATLGAVESASLAPSEAAGELHAAWLRGSGAAFADAASRARRIRETRSLLVRGAAIPGAELEPSVFVVAAIGEVVAELREQPPTSLSQPRAYEVSLRLLEACLSVGR